jgi:cytochrome c553
VNTNQLVWSILLIVVGVLVVAACSPAAPEAPAAQAEEAEHHEEVDQHNEAEHRDSAAHIHVDPPHEYAELTNSLSGNAEAVVAGQVIYETHCSTCHGEAGKGDGPGAAELDPKPANLSDAAMMNELSDSYLFWRISEGGAMEPFNSAMIAWKGTLSEEERWQVVNYLRIFVEVEIDTHAEAEQHDEGDEQHADDHEAEDEHHEDEHQAEEEHHEDEHDEEEHHEDSGD